MHATESESIPMKNETTIERTSDREVVVKRTFNAPARIVFKAWTTPELFKKWWVPNGNLWREQTTTDPLFAGVTLPKVPAVGGQPEVITTKTLVINAKIP